MHLRSIEHQHVEQCAALFLRVFNSPPWSEAWTMPTAAARLTDLCNMPGFYGVVASKETKVAGFAAGYVEQWDRAKHFYLREMCVALDYQREGVGTMLMQTIDAAVATLGVERIYLLTERASVAEAFYRKNGFSVSGKIVMMGKNLKA